MAEERREWLNFKFCPIRPNSAQNCPILPFYSQLCPNVPKTETAFFTRRNLAPRFYLTVRPADIADHRINNI
jgi:hypothetical protein